MTTAHVFQLKSRILSAIAAPELLYWVSNLLESGAQALVIDLKNVSFMDGSGLGALVIAQNRALKAGSRLALCALGGQARMLFETAGLDASFEIYTSLDEYKTTLPDDSLVSIEVAERD